MKRIVNISFLLFWAVLANAQEKPLVIFHLQSADTLVYKSIINQIGNLKKEIPDVSAQIVCHGPGMDFLLKEKYSYAQRLHNLNIKDLTLVGCEFTMKQKNIAKQDLVSFATTVPYGVAEIVKKQQAGWLYVKLGF